MGRRIAANLRHSGIEATFCLAEQVKSIQGYELVVLGSAVYANKMLPAMTALVYRWGDQLAACRTYLFCSGPLDAPVPGNVPLPPDARALMRLSGVKDSRMFGGAMALDRLRPSERALMRIWGSKSGDYRDWAEVDAWSAQIASQALGQARDEAAGDGARDEAAGDGPDETPPTA
jgi:menaquinone-dependent protoporphyrinogen oxidase